MKDKKGEGSILSNSVILCFTIRRGLWNLILYETFGTSQPKVKDKKHMNGTIIFFFLFFFPISVNVALKCLENSEIVNMTYTTKHPKIRQTRG